MSNQRLAPSPWAVYLIMLVAAVLIILAGWGVVRLIDYVAHEPPQGMMLGER